MLPVAKSEKQAVLAVLQALALEEDGPADVVAFEEVQEDLGAICRAAYDARESRKQFTIVIPAKGLSRCYGSFPTAKAAEKFIASGKLLILPREKAFIVPLYHKEVPDE